MDKIEKVRQEMEAIDRQITTMLDEIQRNNPDFRITPSIHQNPTPQGWRYVLCTKAELRPAPRQ